MPKFVLSVATHGHDPSLLLRLPRSQGLGPRSAPYSLPRFLFFPQRRWAPRSQGLDQLTPLCGGLAAGLGCAGLTAWVRAAVPPRRGRRGVATVHGRIGSHCPTQIPRLGGAATVAQVLVLVWWHGGGPGAPRPWSSPSGAVLLGLAGRPVRPPPRRPPRGGASEPEVEREFKQEVAIRFLAHHGSLPNRCSPSPHPLLPPPLPLPGPSPQI
jgi:hypothetical protein